MIFLSCYSFPKRLLTAFVLRTRSWKESTALVSTLPSDRRPQQRTSRTPLSQGSRRRTSISVGMCDAIHCVEHAVSMQRTHSVVYTREKALLDSCRRCFASLFTNRAISYRTLKGFDHFDVGLSIGVQKMVRSDTASSGVMFSIDTESGFRDVVMMSGAWGLGENVVQGAVNPDEWYVFKPTLNAEDGRYRPIVTAKLGSKHKRMVYSNKPGEFVTNVPTTQEMRNTMCLNDDEVLKLAKWACTIEDHYSTIRGTYTPMDIEWAKDGRTGELFIVQARPETVHSQEDATKLKRFVLDGEAEAVVEGSAVGARVGSGQVQVILDPAAIKDFRKGQVLVTEMTDP